MMWKPVNLEKPTGEDAHVEYIPPLRAYRIAPGTGKEVPIFPVGLVGVSTKQNPDGSGPSDGADSLLKTPSASAYGQVVHNSTNSERTLAVASDWVSSCLPPGWRVEDKVRISGTSAGTKDKYYFSPEGRRFRSKREVLAYIEKGSIAKRKKQNKDPSPGAKGPDISSTTNSVATFDYGNTPASVEWVLVDANDDRWTAFLDGQLVDDIERQRWEDGFALKTSRSTN